MAAASDVGPTGNTPRESCVGRYVTTSATPGTVTMYATSWCPYCIRLRGQLKAHDIPFVEIDIDDDPAAAEFVASVNGGNQVVPTLKFPDGQTATNPPIKGVLRRLGMPRE